MPNLEWELKDSNECDGCPLLKTTSKILGLSKCSCLLGFFAGRMGILKRPKECIAKFGD